MQALEEDKYVRQTDGYLPAASVAFIDEIFKANSAILNTLLTILNERLFDNGTERLTVPLICLVRCTAGNASCSLLCTATCLQLLSPLGPFARTPATCSATQQHSRLTVHPCSFPCLQVGASNELPESEELDALYDRFLVSQKGA